MIDLPPNLDPETRISFAELKAGQNPALVAFIETREEQMISVHKPLDALDIDILGSAGCVALVRCPARSLIPAASLEGVVGIEAWPAANRQRGPHRSDLELLKNVPSTESRPIAALVRLRTEPDAATKETMSLIGLSLFAGQTGLLQAATMPARGLEDVLAIPAIAAVKISHASLNALRDKPSEGSPPSIAKINATTRILLQETPARDNPTVPVFVEFASPPTAEETAKMETLGLRLIPGGSPIKTGRIPLRSIDALSALHCVAAIEASTPLQLDRSNANQDSSSTKP